MIVAGLIKVEVFSMIGKMNRCLYVSLNLYLKIKIKATLMRYKQDRNQIFVGFHINVFIPFFILCKMISMNRDLLKCFDTQCTWCSWTFTCFLFYIKISWTKRIGKKMMRVYYQPNHIVSLIFRYVGPYSRKWTNFSPGLNLD